MLYLLLALAVLVVIVTTTLKVESLGKKVTVFLGLGFSVFIGLWNFGGETGREVLHHVYVVDYAQFIMIPICTVLIASLQLFSIKRASNGVGYFILGLCPLIGNSGTTWALVPIGLSLIPILQKQYPDRWKRILIRECIMSMNMLALATLAADPPQALLAVKEAARGNPLGFFWPFTIFWPYICITWYVYFVSLKRSGVEFGNPLKELKGIRPECWNRVVYGVILAAGVGLSITFLRGYEITVALGLLSVVAFLSAFAFFGHDERHNTIHWCIETATIFVAFFAVVCLAHTGLHHVHINNQSMIWVVVGLTLAADNAAAFAAAYPQFAPLASEYMQWYALFPSVTFGGLSPLGNGPQIALFLVVMVSKKIMSPKEIFVAWMKEAWVFAPYLITWVLSMSTLIYFEVELLLSLQLLTGMVAAYFCFEAMDHSRHFKAYVDNGEEVERRVEARWDDHHLNLGSASDLEASLKCPPMTTERPRL